MKDTIEPRVSLLNTLPVNALFVEKLACLVREGLQQHALHWREYVRREAKEVWPRRRISQDEMTRAYEYARRVA